jgi:hypothetical protein
VSLGGDSPFARKRHIQGTSEISVNETTSSFPRTSNTSSCNFMQFGRVPITLKTARKPGRNHCHTASNRADCCHVWLISPWRLAIFPHDQLSACHFVHGNSTTSIPMQRTLIQMRHLLLLRDANAHTRKSIPCLLSQERRYFPVKRVQFARTPAQEEAATTWYFA